MLRLRMLNFHCIIFIKIGIIDDEIGIFVNSVLA